MGLLDRIKQRRARRNGDAGSSAPAVFAVSFDSRGATWTAEGGTLEALSAGEHMGGIDEQYVALDMLTEAGSALALSNGFAMTHESLSGLGDGIAHLLGLPPRFVGEFVTEQRQNTTSANFDYQVSARRRQHPEPYAREGARMTVGDETFLLTTPVLHALQAIEEHQKVAVGRRQEADNVYLVAKLQKAQQDAEHFRPDDLDDAENAPAGTAFPLDLGYFAKFTTHVPRRVGLNVRELEDGSLRLAPDLGGGIDPDDVLHRRQQIKDNRETNVLRVNDAIIYLDKESGDGVKEILRRPHIPADRVQDFYNAPGSFIDATKVDIHLSFSVRVKGIGALAPVTFNDAGESGIKWIDEVETVQDPEVIPDLATDEDSLTDIEDAIETSRESGSATAAVDGHVIDISDEQRVNTAIARARDGLLEPPGPMPEKPDDAVQVGVILEEVDSLSVRLRKSAADAELARPVDYGRLRMRPYPHQCEGIEWMAKLMAASLDGHLDSPTRIQGSLLADDMGLGKTFMALVALREFRELQRLRGEVPLPTLVVLPLTLIENWEDEIKASFAESPFRDVVVLQADRDLNLFRYRGSTRESRASASQLDDDGMLREEDIVLSLAVGDAAGDDRLDKPGRLVLTTYETLSSYQLSLGQVEWGTVVFDEAQKIKNPEVLVSRAAKGLKARFKLVATGTPVENRLQDMWSLMDTAQPGLLGTWPEFKKAWVRSVENGTTAEQEASGRQLADLIRPFMMRRIKEDHLKDLPTKTIHSGVDAPGVRYDPALYREMPPEQADRYKTALGSHQARAGQKGAALKTLQALRAISLHPRATDKSMDSAVSPDVAARMLATFEILDRIQANDEKVIVFVINKYIQRRMALWLRQRFGIAVHVVNGETKATSGGSSASRKQLVEDFQRREGFNVIIMSPLAAGTGLTVVGANHAIHLERHWNPAKEAQATDRVYRIGQVKPVHVYMPLAVHPDESVSSFDVNLNNLLQQKTDLKDAVVVPEIKAADIAKAMNF